jgi:predicted ArsR family transcriptional regulator
MIDNQLDWLSREHARRSDPATSKAAAGTMKFAAMSLCDRILEILGCTGPATAGELALCLKLDDHQVNKRTADLKNAGLIEASGETRKGASGRQQTVWRIK